MSKKPAYLRMDSVPYKVTFVYGLILAAALGSCTRSYVAMPEEALARLRIQAIGTPTLIQPSTTPTEHPLQVMLPPTQEPGKLEPTPTPDPYREPPATISAPDYYNVLSGDTLNDIAFQFGVGAQQIAGANSLINPNFLYVNQVLFIPTPYPQAPGPSFKIIPDSAFVYGPAAEVFDMDAALGRWNGSLVHHVQGVDEKNLTGPQVVELVARRYSIDPRLLLTALEYQGGWITGRPASEDLEQYPLGYFMTGREGLYSQLSWAANELSHGFYLWRVGWSGPYHFTDGVVVNPGMGINAGTAGIQQLLAQLYAVETWRHVVSERGFYQTYVELFGSPFQGAIDQLVPKDLVQPTLQLPFEPGALWSFTGGPHRAWGSGTGWAALDFAPPGYALGCVRSDAWVVAMADGLIVRSDQGEVVQEIDGDGFEGAGWSLLYLHIETRDRVEPGSYLLAGERVGHPSCEGGVALGTHVHVGRKYNGEWIPADGSLPFIVDGWISAGWGREYDGTLSRDGTTLEACACRTTTNMISR